MFEYSKPYALANESFELFESIHQFNIRTKKEGSHDIYYTNFDITFH